MIIYLYGPDTFRSRQQLKKMIEKFKIDRDPQGLNVTVLDCQKEEISTILEQMVVVPFLADRRMVVFENLVSATGKKELQEEVFGRIKNNSIPETTVALFWEGAGKPKTDISKKMHTILAKEKFAQEFKGLAGVQLEGWITERAREFGGAIGPQAARYIVANVGGDMWRIHSLVAQLIAYTRQEITINDVRLFLDQKEDDNIFNLVDALVAGNSKRVYAMIREQYAEGKEAQFIFSMLLRQFRILLELRDIFEREDAPRSDDIAKRLALHPFVVKKTVPFVKRYTTVHLVRIYQALLDMEIKIKTGQGDQSVLLDVFVGKQMV